MSKGNDFRADDARGREQFAMVWKADMDSDAVRGLTGNAFRVWVALCLYANAGRGQVYPKRRTLAEVVGIAKRSIRRSITELEAAGLVKRHETDPQRVTLLPAPEGGRSRPGEDAQVRGEDVAVPRGEDVAVPQQQTSRSTDQEQQKNVCADAPTLNLEPPEQQADKKPEEQVIDLWMAEHAARNERHVKRTGHPVPGKPRRRPHAAPACLTQALKRYPLEDILLVVRWAFNGDGYHAKHLRGENGGDGKSYLGIANLFVVSKLDSKLYQAHQWEDRPKPLLRGERPKQPEKTEAEKAAEWEAFEKAIAEDWGEEEVWSE